MKKVEIGLEFEDSQHGQGGGLPVLKTFFERFGFSGIYSDIDKHSGAAAWKIIFAYIAASNWIRVPRVERLPPASSRSCLAAGTLALG